MARRQKPPVEPGQKSQKKSGIRWIILLLVLVAVTVFMLFLNRDNPMLRAFFGGVNFQVTRSADGELPLEKTEKYFFAGSKDGVVIAQADTLSMVTPSLGTVWEIPMVSTSPVVKTSGAYVLAYDMDTNGATVVKDGNPTEISTDDAVIIGTINKNGYVALVTKEKGYKAQIIVYDPSGTVIYKWHSADSYVIDVALSPANNCLAAATLDLSKDMASGGLMMFQFSQEKPFAGQVLEGNLLLKVQFADKNTLLAIGDTAAAGFDVLGGKLWNVEYSGKQLATYDISDNGNLVLAFHQQDSVLSGSEVKIYGSNGKEKGTYQTTEQITGVDAMENDILLTQARKLTLISARGGELKSLEINRDIKNAVLFQDRKHALVVSGSAAQVLQLK